MSRTLANKKFTEAVTVMHKNGIDPLDYMLSFIMGTMDAKNLSEYRAEFEDRVMTINLTAPDSVPAESVH